MHDPSSELTEEQKMALCQQRIGYQFRDITLLRSALTHASGASNRLASNERMEFLGDSVLGFCICEYLFRQHVEYLEGELTQIKSAVVSRRVCARISHALGLDECLILGRGMSQGTGMPKSLLSDVYEAIIAAIYLDGGWAAASEFILRTIDEELRHAVDGHSIGNYKSALQQLTQRVQGSAPVYRLVAESGPDHSKIFLVAAEVKGRRYSPAWGRTKKEAEQRAAGNALAEIDKREPPYTQPLS
ncbi:MAG TPA: ribonuclease III [Planctomycetaceae bacterium]|nr:ribonuclease III [Planctomycetaceae bacterium]